MSNSNPVLIIIGNGITGITAARTVRKAYPEMEIKIISNETDYFYSRTALMYIYMGHMRARDTEPYERRFYAENRLELIRAEVASLDSAAKSIRLDSDASLNYDFLLIATGAKPNKFGWPGQDLPRVQGLYSMQDLESLEAITKPGQSQVQHAAIVGGGLIGIELAEMLHTRHIPVTMLVREHSYWNNILPPEESEMINQEIREHGIDLRLDTELKEILPAQDGGAGICVTSQGDQVAAQFVGLTAGVSPNVDFLKSSGLEIARGVLVDQSLKTSARDVYAAGDCAQLKKDDGSPGPVEQLWYTGRMQGETAGQQIARAAYEQAGQTEKARSVSAGPYSRGIWFNSAKFFTIEYHTYGFVPATLPEQSTHVWQDQERKQLIRLVWDQDDPTKPLTGMNSLGVRFQHRVFENWIAQRVSIDQVVDQLGKALFDPEFFKRQDKPFRKSYRQRFPGGQKQSA